MKDYERKLTEEELKKVEEHNGDVYCLFSEAQLLGRGVYDAVIRTIDGEKVLRYSMGDSCD